MPIRYRTTTGTHVTAANYADAVAVAEHYGMGKIVKASAEEVPNYNEDFGANPKRYQRGGAGMAYYAKAKEP
jgi:hypothetical protein